LYPPLGQEHLFISFRRGTSWGQAIQIHYDGDDWTSNDDGEPQISPDGAMLYFDWPRSVSINVNRTRAQFLSNAARIDEWDNGNSNVWTLPLRPLLNALGHRHEDADAAK